MSTVLTEIISLLVAGITGIATGIGEGLTALVQNIFLVTSDQGVTSLSTFGGVIVVFAGKEKMLARKAICVK